MILERYDRIRTLRAVGRLADPLARRLMLDRAFSAAELHPATLPRGAVLCVRRLRVTMPSADGVAHRWTSAVARRIPELVQHASRPFRDAVPASSDTVLFLDEAELLACLARDWVARRADAWWWRGLFGENATEALVCRAWIAAPQLVPAALELLARAGGATNVVRALPALYCDELGDRVTLTFAVPGWSDTTEQLPQAPTNDHRTAVDVERPAALLHDEQIETLSRAYDFRSLAAPQRALLAIALLLQCAPRVARTPKIIRWLRTTEWLDSPTAAAPVARPGSRAVDSSASASTEDPTPHAAPALALPHPRSPERESPRATDPIASGRQTRSVADNSEQVVHEMTRVPATPPDAHSAAAPTDTIAQDELSVESDFAGVLYLLNAALYLDLYADFTQPHGRNYPLHVGDFLAALGDIACREDFRDDAIWTLLAALSGREPREHPIPREGVHPPLEDIADMLATHTARALGVDASDALRYLCHRSGSVVLSATRLDVTFDLASHPLEIRLAGLDRDPGWIPAAGRVVAFHYE